MGPLNPHSLTSESLFYHPEMSSSGEYRVYCRKRAFRPTRDAQKYRGEKKKQKSISDSQQIQYEGRKPDGATDGSIQNQNQSPDSRITNSSRLLKLWEDEERLPSSPAASTRININILTIKYSYLCKSESE